MNSSLKVLVVPGRAVMSEQGVQEGTKYTPLRGPSIKDQRGRCVVVQDPFAEFSPRVLSLVMSFVGTMVLNAEL